MTNCCDDFGTCTRGANCQARAGTVPPEAGNVRLPPVDYDGGQPLSHDENMAMGRTLLLWLISVVTVVGTVSIFVSFGTEHYAELLWGLLATLS
ncbi:MAG: hypothetical protein M0P52_00060 [Rhodoferax sp.]|nr:hypothetical protein [Rhodoferax sp.]